MSEFRPRPGEVDDILRRGVRLRYRHAAVAGLAAGVAALALVVPNAVDRIAVQPARPGLPTASPTATAATTTSPSASPVATPSPTAAGTAPVTGPTASAPAVALRCDADGNGGATDRGVTASSIELFTTVSPQGLLGSPGEDWRRVQDLMLTRTNRSGGICGRALHVTTVDNGGDQDPDARALREAIDRTFAIPFIGDPASLEAVLSDVARTRTPVVGVTGRDPVFYDAGWVWPAGVSEAVAARLMAREAHQRGARSFGVVFDDKEVGGAFDAEVVRLTGQHAKQVDFTQCRPCSDSDVVTGVNKMYTGPPAFVGVLLQQQTTAIKWMRNAPAPYQVDRIPSHGHGGTDVFLNPDVREICQDKCHGLRAWSAYKADCGYGDDAAYQRYRADLAALDVDATPETAAVYAATELLLDAVRRTGPDLTRDRLRRVLDGTPLRADMTVAETIDGGNDTMRAYVLSWSSGASGCSAGPVARL